MSTTQQIINRSLRLIGVLASGETPSADESADALTALNAMLDAWRTESLMVYALRDETLTITGASSYTIGSGGALNTVRPVKIESAYLRLSGIDYPLHIAQANQWNLIADKSTTSSIPDWLYYETAFPLGKLWLYPIPDSGVLHLSTWVPFSAFALADSVILPPGYEEAITYQLAMRIAPEYGSQAAQEIAAMGAAAKKDIKRVNFRIPIMDTGLMKGRRYDIKADY